MKIKFLYYLLIPILLAATTGCIKVKDFTKDEIKWFNPYGKNDTVIFISSKSELDTMIFYKTVVTRDTVRSFERGFYNQIYLTVPYKITEGSYHHFALTGQGKDRYDQNIFNISKTSDGLTTLEITFLGTIFDGQELHNIERINSYVYYFDSQKATYVGMDEEKGKAIKDFTFDVRSGIIKYIDERNIEWKRK